MKVGDKVIHESDRAGTIVRVFAPGEYTDPNGNAIATEVIELSTGDKFIANPEAFAQLTPELALILRVVEQNAERAVREVVQLVGSLQPRLAPRALRMVAGALEAQAAATRAAAEALAEGGGDPL